MAVYQGPIYDEQMFLGATGYWDRTMRPHFFYITHPYNNFDITRAEIIGAIDGKFLLSVNIKNFIIPCNDTLKVFHYTI
jgi:hypothetical protein